MAVSQTGNEQYLEKPLPSSEDSERAVLGAVLLDNALVVHAIENLQIDDFYVPRHRKIYAAMVELFNRSTTIDPITISEELKKTSSLDSMGGIVAISSLMSGLPHFTDIEDYVRIVSDKARLRKLIRVCNQIVSEALSEEEECDVVLEEAEERIFELSDARAREGFVPVARVADDLLEEIYAYANNDSNSDLTGLSTGFRDFDQMTSGLQKTDLIIIAARPSMGKTALCLNIAQHAGVKLNGVVAFFSLEMSRSQLVMRMISSGARVDAKRLKTGFVSTKDWENVGKTVAEISASRIFISDKPAITISEMRANLRRLVAEQKQLDLIVVDYLQLMSGGARNESRQQEVSKISRELKAIAKEMNVPVIALSQLSRAPEARNPPIPTMSDLRESGSIEQDADLVAFIYREEYYNKENKDQNDATIIVSKHRNGPTGTFELSFVKQFTLFEDWSAQSGWETRANSNGENEN